MSDIKDESKLERIRQERLGGVFFYFNDDEGNVEWPEHWTEVEIENYYSYPLELEKKYG